IQGGQTLDNTSFNISIAKASTPNTDLRYLKLNEFQDESNATFLTTDNTINITIPQAYVKDKMIQIGYRTKITQKNRPIFHNNSKATYTLTGEEPITSIDNIGVKNTSANTGITGTKQGELKILKVITGTETPIEGVKFVLKRKDNTQINNATSITLTTDKDGIANVKGLPDGEYSFKETYAPEWVKFDPTSATSNTFTILSDAKEGIYKMVENPIKTVDITVAKKWWGKNTDSKSATINLLADGIEVDSITKIGSKWEYIFKDMPVYNTETGKEITYKVTEDHIVGYKSEVGFNEKLNKFFVTNTELKDITVNKVWVGKAGTSATVNLFVVYNTKSSQIDSFKLSKDNNWTHTFKDLPTNFHGEPYSYYVTEDQIDGYKSERTWSKENGFTFTNTQDGYVPSPDPIPLPPDPKPPLPLPSPNPDPIITPSLETVSIPVIKNWVGKVGSGADMRLLANGTEIQKITLNEVNQWKHIFADLPKYDKTTGREIVYTLSEVPVDGYNTVITGDSKIGFTVTNTTTDKVSVGVTKQWVGKAKASIIVNIFADGKKIESKALSKDNGWQHTFTNLPQYKDGKKIKYTISEDEITGYDVRITGDVNSGFIIENTEVEKLLNNYKDIENPKTGDPSNLFGYGVLLIMAGMGVILVTRRKNKSK
ncbi:MAG: Cna B-type domain-containing protein, partial [Anaerovoracaceae bacterium]